MPWPGETLPCDTGEALRVLQRHGEALRVCNGPARPAPGRAAPSDTRDMPSRLRSAV